MKKEQNNCEQSSFISNKYSLKSKKKKSNYNKKKKKRMWDVGNRRKRMAECRVVFDGCMDLFHYSTSVNF